MSKLDTVQNGKGSAFKQRVNINAYRNAEYWEILEKRKAEAKEKQKTASEYFLPDEQTKNS